MSKRVYPESLDCWLKNFPRYIKIICGPAMANLGGPWVNGSVLLLERIGFDTPNTSPIVGVTQPDVKVTYSDNGTDSGWIFKIGFYGWGTFFATIPGSYYYVLTEKFLEFESNYFSKINFRHREVFETQIDEGVSIPNVTVPITIIDNPPIDPGSGSSGGGSSSGTDNLDLLDHALLATNLINCYWNFWGINYLGSVTVTKHRAATLDVIGLRELICARTTYNQLIVQFWLGAGFLKVTFGSIAIECDTFNFGDGFEDCSYTSFVSDSFTWTDLILNGIDKMSILLQRA
jgi:hypothetical protein